MSSRIFRDTVYIIRDLHARESMRLSWYRHYKGGEKIKLLRAQKAMHRAFLNDLLRRRALKPAWYSFFFYYTGHFFGILSAFLPQRMAIWIENRLECWILIRYEKYLKRLQIQFDIRSMIEAMQMRKLNHNEPGNDVIDLLENNIRNEKNFLDARY